MRESFEVRLNEILSVPKNVDRYSTRFDRNNIFDFIGDLGYEVLIEKLPTLLNSFEKIPISARYDALFTLIKRVKDVDLGDSQLACIDAKLDDFLIDLTNSLDTDRLYELIESIKALPKVIQQNFKTLVELNDKFPESIKYFSFSSLIEGIEGPFLLDQFSFILQKLEEISNENRKYYVFTKIVDKFGEIEIKDKLHDLLSIIDNFSDNREKSLSFRYLIKSLKKKKLLHNNLELLNERFPEFTEDLE